MSAESSGWSYALEAYPLELGCPQPHRLMSGLLHDKTGIGNGVHDHRVLEQAIKELSAMVRQSPVEAKRELIQILVEVLPGDSALVNPQEPPFEQGGHPMHTGQQGRGGLPTAADGSGLVVIAVLGQAGVGGPAIGGDDGSRRDRLPHEPHQTPSGGIRESLESDAPDAPTSHLGSDGDQRFGLPEVALPSTRLDPAHVDFVHFDHLRQGLATGAHHGTPQLVQARPGGLITPQPQGALQPQRPDTALLVGDPPDGPEPHPQGQVAPVEDRPSGHRHDRVTTATLEETLLQAPGPSLTAAGAAKSFRPPQAGQVRPAVLFGTEAVFEFQQGSRVVLVHAPRLPLGVT